MRPVALFCRAFAASRHKTYALCEQLYGKGSVDVYRCKGKLSDPEIADTDREHIWSSAEEVVPALVQHQIIHAFCDEAALLLPLLKTGRKFVAHQPDVLTMRGAIDIGEASVHMSDKTVSVFPSESCRRYMRKRLRLPKKDTYVFKAMPVLEWQPEIPKPKDRIPNSLVYAGYVTTDPAAPNGFRYFGDIFRTIMDAGIHIYLMNAGEAVFPAVLEAYKAPGMTNLHMKIGKPYRKLYEELARYDVGFCGFTRPPELPDEVKDYGDMSMPNKAFDYMFAGIPTLGHNIKEASSYVNKWGKCTEDPDKLVETFYQVQEMNIDYEKLRHEYCAETQREMLREIHGRVAE